MQDVDLTQVPDDDLQNEVWRRSSRSSFFTRTRQALNDLRNALFERDRGPGYAEAGDLALIAKAFGVNPHELELYLERARWDCSKALGEEDDSFVNPWATNPTRTLLDIPMDPKTNGADATTVGGYLRALLAEVWTKGAEFSGKRPFGNSGWEYDIYTALIRADFMKGKLDEDGYVESIADGEPSRINQIILDAIWNLR